MTIEYKDLTQMAAAFKKQVACDLLFVNRLLEDVNTIPSHHRSS